MSIAVRNSLAAALIALAGGARAGEPDLWRAQARRVTITRDDWGIAHIHGATDADAVFGAILAQAEDDFGRIERNYLVALGRLAEADGPAALMQDLRARLFVDPADLQARLQAAPPDLRALCQAWADGLNFFLATHPAVQPRVLRRFEPWMPLAFSEGSIGGDIERIDLDTLGRFYAPQRHAAAEDPAAQLEPGSNGIAIAPKLTAGGHALLLINPHTSFYFRSELQMASDAGLDAYGAATWGQFFLYQGFNAHLGWMHTSTTASAVDIFRETIARHGEDITTRYGTAWRPVSQRRVVLSYRTPQGGQGQHAYTVYRTTHGPVIGADSAGHWLSIALMFKPVQALQQGFALTKAADLPGFMRAMALRANSSNNTVYADDAGNILYLHPQFLPRRDDRIPAGQPRDGADPGADWNGEHALGDLPRLLNPATGFIQNTNNGPWTASGVASPRAADFPRYMDTEGQNMRGVHALSLLALAHGVTRDWLMHAAYDSALPGFDILLPPLFRAYDTLPAQDARRRALAAQIDVLRQWNRRWSAESLATGLAIAWAEILWRDLHVTGASTSSYDQVVARATPQVLLGALGAASARLDQDFGTWRTPWGAQNRLQRLDDTPVPHFSDSAPSIPVPFTAGQWGSLASVTGPRFQGTRHRFGTSGNSFVAVVEFGPRVQAVAVTAGGESGHPGSPHFNDEAARYAAGKLRPVYFDEDDLKHHTERKYHPGD